MSTEIEKRAAHWTHDRIHDDGGHLYYFAPSNRQAPPYRKQLHVKAIIDVAMDGTLAGVELIDPQMPPPPSNPSRLDAETARLRALLLEAELALRPLASLQIPDLAEDRLELDEVFNDLPIIGDIRRAAVIAKKIREEIAPPLPAPPGTGK